MLGQACHAGQLWRRSVPDCAELGVAVNVSMRQVLSGRLVDHVAEALPASALPAEALTLEITENSSLGFVMGLKADVLKIDRTLLDSDPVRRGSLVTAIAELGRTLGLMVVVEGVETKDHLTEVPRFLARQEIGG